MSATSPRTPAELLRELVALVRGECPSLLNEDSGGDARLSLEIDDALLTASPAAPPLVDREQLKRIEWAGTDAGCRQVCPACRNNEWPHREHRPDCWLGAVLAPPVPAPPPAPPAPALVERDGKALHWSVSVERNGENLVVIESNCLSGKPEFTDAEADTIREAAAHLLAFIGRPSPLPSGPPAPVAMPEIQLGDVIETIAGNAETIQRQDYADYWNDPREKLMRRGRVAAIYRTPLWRRPDGETR